MSLAKNINQTLLCLGQQDILLADKKHKNKSNNYKATPFLMETSKSFSTILILSEWKLHHQRSRQKIKMPRISMFPGLVLHSIYSYRTPHSAQFNINFFLTSRLRSWDTVRTITDGKRKSMKRKLLQSVCWEETETPSTDLNKFFTTRRVGQVFRDFSLHWCVLLRWFIFHN